MSSPDEAKPAVRVVNLTAHPVTVLDGDRVVATWAPAGPVARLVETRSAGWTLRTPLGSVRAVALRYAEESSDLPDPIPGTVYVVSRILAAAVPRPDVYAPVDEVRDAAGRILGCRALGTFAPGAEER